jgi:porin
MDPLLQPDPLAFLFQPLNRIVKKTQLRDRIEFGATYTFLEQYATATPNFARHGQASGRLDFTGVWRAYSREGSAGSVSLLLRSGANIGTDQQFNLSDKLGSGLYLNALQGAGPQEPITVNVLYWREDLFDKRASLYVGKIHPNQYVSLSMFDNDERTQFLNGESDGNVAFAYDGTYAGGAAVEFQATRHLYFHTLAVDTEGSSQGNLKTLLYRKYMESAEAGWFSGSPGKQYRDYRIYVWRDDTQALGSGYGGGLGFEHEFANGWAPFGKFGIATDRGTAIRQSNTLGVAQVHPFARSGDMFGASFSYTEPNKAGRHHESVFESFYRLRLTQSIGLGPDLEISVHPTSAVKAHTTAVLGTRLEIVF